MRRVAQGSSSDDDGSDWSDDSTPGAARRRRRRRQSSAGSREGEYRHRGTVELRRTSLDVTQKAPPVMLGQAAAGLGESGA